MVQNRERQPDNQLRLKACFLCLEIESRRFGSLLVLSRARAPRASARCRDAPMSGTSTTATCRAPGWMSTRNSAFEVPSGNCAGEWAVVG